MEMKQFYLTEICQIIKGNYLISISLLLIWIK
jgi:hypothetical protein